MVRLFLDGIVYGLITALAMHIFVTDDSSCYAKALCLTVVACSILAFALQADHLWKERKMNNKCQ